MKKLLFLFLIFNISFATAQTTPEIGPYVEGYRGPKLEEVWLLRIGPRADHTFLVQIAGVDHDWNHTIVKCEVKKDNDAPAAYTVIYNEEPYALMTQKSYTELELRLPDDKTAILLTYDKELSLEGNREAFLADYLAAQRRAQ